MRISKIIVVMAIIREHLTPGELNQLTAAAGEAAFVAQAEL